MSEEEKKAIDYLQLCYDLSTIDNESLSKLAIVLNLIKKQQEQLQEKDKHIQHIENINKHQSNDIKKAVDDNFELNKIIGLMAEQLAGLTIFDNDKESPLILGDADEVIEYYEEKAREVQWKIK